MQVYSPSSPPLHNRTWHKISKDGGWGRELTEQSKEADQRPSGETARPEMPQPAWWPVRLAILSPSATPLIGHSDTLMSLSMSVGHLRRS